MSFKDFILLRTFHFYRLNICTPHLLPCLRILGRFCREGGNTKKSEIDKNTKNTKKIQKNTKKYKKI